MFIHNVMRNALFTITYKGLIYQLIPLLALHCYFSFHGLLLHFRMRGGETKYSEKNSFYKVYCKIISQTNYSHYCRKFCFFQVSSALAKKATNQGQPKKKDALVKYLNNK